MTPRYFLFDIGNVLVDFKFQMLLDRIAADSGRALIRPTRRDLKHYEAVEEGRISDQDFVDYLNAAKGLDWSLDQYIEVWAEMFTVNPVGRTLFEEALQRGWPVYTLSNIAGHHIEAIERGHPGFFNGAAGMFLSYQLGARKPSRTIYRRVLEQLHAEGAQCFFIDDRPENVEAARAEGMQAHPFSDDQHDFLLAAARDFFETQS